jgi:O-antigen ligase
MINYIVGFCFLLLPFINSKQLSDVFEYPKVITLIITVNTILAIKFWQIIHNPKKYLKLNLTDKLLILLILWLIICWGVNGFEAVSFWGQYYRYEGLITLWSLFVFYFLISRFTKTKILNQFITISGIINSIYITVWGILSQVFKLPLYTFYERTAATFGNPNFAAGFLALSYPFLLYSSKIKPRWKLIATSIFLTALYFTQSRSGLLAFFTILILFLIKRYKYRFVIIVPIFILAALTITKAIPRYSTFNNQFIIWEKAIIAISKKPFFGWGMERFGIAFQETLIPNKDFNLYNLKVDKTHNEILEYGISGGIPALILYVFLLANCLINLLKQKLSPLYWLNISVLMAYFILSQLNVLNITEYLFFYFILAEARQNYN